MSDTPVLSVSDLAVDFLTHDGTIHAVNGVSFELYPGETLGIVGESGSGKSVSVLSVIGLVPTPPGRIVTGSAVFHVRRSRSAARFVGPGPTNLLGEDLLTASASRLREIRGSDIAVVFQDPDTALNPVLRIGNQLVEAILVNDRGRSRRAARARAVELLELVGLSDPAARLRQYPFELSGGMRQRVMIAMAIANRPRILIADEPTTALDVTVQAQILDVLLLAQQETGAATILITHDLGVIAEMADRVLVMYAGRIVESATVDRLFDRPLHPYTEALLASRPTLTDEPGELFSIPGAPPLLVGGMPPGCPFAARCHRRRERATCVDEVPALAAAEPGRAVACHFWSEAYEGVPG